MKSANSKKKKDLEKQRKQAEEEACAEAYEQFVATFDAPKTSSKVFVRGNVINSSSGQEISSEHSGKYYKADKLDELEQRRQEQLRKNENKSRDSSKKSSSSNDRIYVGDKPSKKKGDAKKKSNLEIFKEELKMIQEERERSKQKSSHSFKEKSGFKSSLYDGDDSCSKKGSHDTGDPNTTNIYLGNINPSMTENELCEIFGRYGPLASVKIMWPRSDEERNRNRNCGFVAFMSRIDAERALKALNGRTIMDYEMRLGWGKAIPIPANPVYIPLALRELTLPPPPSGLPFNAQIVEEKDREILQKYNNDPQLLFRANRALFNDLLSRTVVKVVAPTDRNLLHIIHRVVEFIVRDGPMFEALLMSRELNNPTFAFLFNHQSPAHVYYRWRLFSILQGDHLNWWRTKEFRMFQGGSIWRPPPMNLFLQGMPEELLPKDGDDLEFRKDSDGFPILTSGDSDAKKGHLSKEDRENIEESLRALNPQRSKIAEMMLFCIDHADCWEEIVDCITDSLCIDETPLYKKIARLFLVSDILHNCSVKVTNASNFRKGFQAKLSDIFKSFNRTYNQIEGRLKAEHFKQRVMNCFRAWEDSAIFSSDLLIKLQNIFLGLSTEEKEKNKSISHEKMEDIDGIPIIDPYLDGEEMEDGKIPIDPDPFAKKFKKSKWETVDPEQEAKIDTKWANQEINDIYQAEGEDFDDIDGRPLDDDLI